ncbi:protein-disulfide reductase DsbD [Mangrovitalea sediminis]|uniref:protein-disulfide reductase DsbD n=1 Tax=Mangrovitalea sediminis TaxID=1982043 RepID=UPI000BE605F2|nr:protein-disulfide reductase DsbD [Mangrovitalea sediminis]
MITRLFTPLRYLLFCLWPLLAFHGTADARNFFQSSDTQNSFLPVDQAFQFSSRMDGNKLVLDWTITPGYYLYQERISATTDTPHVTVGSLQFSRPGHDKQDPYFGQVRVFLKDISATLPVSLPEGTRTAKLTVTYQGCATAGLCYPPQKKTVLYDAGNAVPKIGTNARPVLASPGQQPETASGITQMLRQQNLVSILLLFYLLGLGLTFTPCVLPMIPIITAIVGGHRHHSHWGNFILCLSYVLGMAITYAAAGVITGLLGASFNLQAIMQEPWVLSVIAGLFVILALSSFGLYELQLPAALRHRLTSTERKLSGGHLGGTFLIGAVSALVVSPCVSAPLAGALVYISATQNAILGGLALFVLALGMGTPLVLVGVAGRRILPRSGPWLQHVKAFYGVLLLAVAVWLITRIVPPAASLVMWALLAALCGVLLGAFDRAASRATRMLRGLGLLLFVYAASLLIGALAGASNPLQPLTPFTQRLASGPIGTAPSASPTLFQRFEDAEQLPDLLATATSQQQPVILDFYADWCISCQVMDHEVFGNPGVRAALASFKRLQLDITKNTPAQQALMKRYGLFGPPAILFFGPKGKELGDFRILGEMDRKQFLEHLARLKSAINSG